jgi:hypothetical protein
MQSPRDKTVFARTQIAKYLSSLLLCNLIQAFGGLLNIAWLVENRIYVGVTCTAQAALKQIGNVRGPFSLPIRVIPHTFHGIRLVQRFSLCNRRPNLLPTLSSSGMDGLHMPYHPHRLMGFPRI